MAKTCAVYDGQRRSLRGLPTNIETVEAAVRSAFGFLAANLEFSWLDEDNDAIALSSDSEVAEAMEIAAKNGSSLVIQVIATGDTAIYLPPEGDSEVEGEDWIVVYDYPKHSEVEAGLQEQASSKEAPENKEDDTEQMLVKMEAEKQALKEEEEKEALEQIAQIERDSEAARQLQRDMQDEDNAQLAEQEHAARELQKQLEYEEQLAMAEIRDAQAKEPAQVDAAVRAQKASGHSEAQKRLSLDVDTWGLVLQLSEMGFGEDFDKLHDVLKKHKMDLSAAAEALIGQA
mmetsp:Transcript_84609/g.137143  ORF Transcript_84609/g.137143 Transcript_84609/m.137143 type:complete len:288 (+) Transcript_84609:24-887(+)